MLVVVGARAFWLEWPGPLRCRGGPLASDPADDDRALLALAAREGRLVRRPSSPRTDPQRLLHTEWHRRGGACWRVYLEYHPTGPNNAAG